MDARGHRTRYAAFMGAFKDLVERPLDILT